MMKTALLLFAPLLATAAPEDVSAELAKLRAPEKIPALAAAAVLDGKIVALGVGGVRKTGTEEKAQTGDLFHLGSCTKSMTASVAAMLVRDGKIGWETTVSETFSGMRIHRDRRGTTLEQLLSNTGGCPGDVPPLLWAELWQNRGSEPAQRLRMAREILKEKPEFPPGTASCYSNAGFTIAGAMLEKVSGESYAELLQERLFKPLGMKSAGFGPQATEDDPDQPHGHRVVSGELVAVPPGPSSDNPPAITPAGRVHCSIEDFAKYANAHLGNSPDVLGAEMLEKLHEPAGNGDGYALGWVVAERDWAGGKALSHTGSNTMNYAVIWLAPAKNFGVVAACNVGGDEGAKACDAAASLLIRRFLEE